MTADPVCKEKRLIEFPLTQAAGMERDGHDQVNGIE
jgi:hypothetical protein